MHINAALVAVHNSTGSAFQSDDVVVRVEGALVLIIYADPAAPKGDMALLQQMARAAAARVRA